MKESKAMVKKEVGFMKKKGAPKSMIKHEMAEMGMKKMNKGGYASGGSMPMVMKDGEKVPAFAADGKGKMAHGGLAAGHKQADGIAKKGKTRGMEVKMAGGGLAAGHKQADGIAKKGKTKAAAGALMDEARALLLKWYGVNPALLDFTLKLEAVRNPLNANLMEF